MTYEREVALLNAVYPNCVSTGGSTVVAREEEMKNGERGTENGECNQESIKNQKCSSQYWLDLRPLATVTLEELMEQYGIDFIDVLKLDCEGSEFSILENTASLDKIGVIVGEYHGRDAFLDLVEWRFAGWKFEILREGDPGTFWLTNRRGWRVEGRGLRVEGPPLPRRIRTEMETTA